MIISLCSVFDSTKILYGSYTNFKYVEYIEVVGVFFFFQSSEMPKLTEQLAGPLRQMQVNVFQFVSRIS